MPIVSYSPSGTTQPERLAYEAEHAVDVPSPFAEPPALRDIEGWGTDAPNWFAVMGLHMQTHTVTGSMAADRLPYTIAGTGYDLSPDPDFDVSEFATNEWLAEHPYMLEDFESGRVLDFPNYERFMLYVARKGDDFDRRELMGRRGLAVNLTAGLFPQIIDWVALAGVGKMIGLAKPAAKTMGWAKTGGGLARANKLGLVAAGLNLTQEEMLRIVNPDRNVDERVAAMYAAGMGYAFGAAIPLAAAGRGGLRARVGTKRINAIQASVKKALSYPEVQGAKSQVDADVATLRGILDNGRPTTRVDDLLGERGYKTDLQRTVQENIARWHDERIDLAPDLPRGQQRYDVSTSPQGGGVRRISGPELNRPIPKFSEDALRRASRTPRKGNRVYAGTLGDFLTGPKVRQLYRTALDTPVYLAEAITGKRPAGARTLGTIFQRSDGTWSIRLMTQDVTEMPRVLLEEGAHVLRAKKGRALAEPGKLETATREQIAALPAERSAAKMVKHAMGLEEDILASTMWEPVPIKVVRHPRTTPMIEQLRAKYGDNLEWIDHEMQGVVDWLANLERADKFSKTARPVDVGRVRDVALTVLGRGIPFRGAEAPALAIAKHPSGMVRRVGRLLFDITLGTQETWDKPLTAHNPAPAEGLLQNLMLRRDKAHLATHSLYRSLRKEGGASYTWADGSTTTIRRKGDFEHAIIDHLWRMGEEAQGYRPEGRPLPKAPTQVAESVQIMRDYFKAYGIDLLEVGMLDKHINPQNIWTSHRWMPHIIERQQQSFYRLLIDQWEHNRKFDFEKGERLDPFMRELDDRVWDHDRSGQLNGRGLTAADRKELFQRLYGGEDAKVPIEADLKQLSHEIYSRYLEEVDIFHDRAATHTIKTLLLPEHAHGVRDAIHTDVTMSQLLQVHPTRFSEFLVSDAHNLLFGYHHQVAGRLAMRQAVKRSYNELAPTVKELTGKDLADHAYDPWLVFDAMQEDFRRMSAMAQGDKASLDAIAAMRESSVSERHGILYHKMRDLEGRNVFAGNPAATAGWQTFLGRAALRMPFYVKLGGVWITSVTDHANNVFFSHMRPKHFKSLMQAMNVFKEVELTSDRQAIAAAMSDVATNCRTTALADIADLQYQANWAPTRSGRFFQRADEAMENVGRKFASASLIVRHNTNTKRVACTLVSNILTEGAQKMARAEALRLGGMGELDALARVGLSQADAMRLSRLGLNGKQCTRLMQILQKHGTDVDGNPIKGDVLTFDGYIAHNYERWFKATHEVRDLFDTVTYAINSEVLNIVPEPKMMSRPLMNRAWLPRVFNQFQSFSYSWGAQTQTGAAMRPGIEQAQWAFASVGYGALASAIFGQLRGYRTIDETIEDWQTKPAAMCYDAITRSAMIGWLARPLNILENVQIAGQPLGPATILDPDRRHGRRAYPPSTEIGPFFSWAKDIGESSHAFLAGRPTWNDRRHRQMFAAMPFYSLWEIDVALRIAEWLDIDVPLVPERRR